MLTHLAEDLRCVLAPNPSAMTGPGTNTWLVGRGDVAVIDPGPSCDGQDMHLQAILSALGSHERITHVFVTHAHLDHSGLASRLAARVGAPVHAFGPATAGRSAFMQSLSMAGLPAGDEGLDHTFRPDVLLAEGDVISHGTWQLRALHTPGHAASHLCFAFGKRLFSGDHVMGWSSSLISPPDGDMAAYMAGLQRLNAQDWDIALPGHGPVITDPRSRISALLTHRQDREAALLSALDRKPLGLSALTRAVYHDVPAAMLPAARRNALAHLLDLMERNVIEVDDICATDPLVTRA